VEKKKISFIVPVWKTEDVLERCIKSLIDQDWDNKEVIVVFDGKPEANTEKRLHKYRKEINIKFVTIPHGGACAARNKGFEFAKGDIVSFFSSDFYAMPGMSRIWMEAFDDHPECDFVYGGYGFISDTHGFARSDGFYPSEEFDPYKLTCYNYIDGGMPIRREIFQKWDINCKSLNDWEWYLRLVMAGAKGHFIKDLVYNAEPPKEGGLSYDSSRNWLERTKYIKDKLGIPDRKICVTSLGAPAHALNVAKMLGADYKPAPNMKPNNYELVYMIGLYSNYPAHFKVLEGMKCKKALHWVGADIYWFRMIPFGAMKHFVKQINKYFDYQFTECPQMQFEMASFGIKTEVLPIAPPGDYKVLPLPKKFTVAVMKTNRSDFDKYMGDLMDEVMAALPMVNFKVFGDGKCKRELANVENCGYVKMSEFIPQCSAILRIVKHDGMMMACNEFVMSGRDAITNLKAPFIHYIDTWYDHDNWDRFSAGLNMHNYPETKKQIIHKILDLKDGKGNKFRTLASIYYKQLLNKGKYIRKIKSLL
jgi:glycosyltransferase involved in cell wall biosynthesis